MTDEVRARTEDLEHFVVTGEPYVAMLDDALDDCRTYRASTMVALGHSVGVDSIRPFQELVAEAMVTNGFVREVHDALVVYGEGADVTVAGAADVDAALGEVGLAIADVALDDDGQDPTLAEDLRRAADAARARGGFDMADSLLAQADELDRYELLIDAGIEPRHAEVIAAGPTELYDAVVAGDVTPLVATLLPSLTPNLQDAIIAGHLTYLEARHIDDAPRALREAVLAGDLTPWEARQLHAAGLGDDEETTMAVVGGELTAAEAVTMAGFPDALRQAVLRGDIPMALAEEIMAGPDEAVEAAAGGDLDRAALLTVDAEVRAARTVGALFPQLFDDDTVDGLEGRIVALGGAGALDDVRARLTHELGLDGAALDAAMADVEHAVAFYGDPINALALVRLDDANDSDPDNDDRAHRDDAHLRVIHLTAGSPTAAHRYLRQLAIADWVAGQRNLDAGDLVDIVEGQSKLRALDAQDQEILVDAFVDSRIDHALGDADGNAHQLTQSPAFHQLQWTADWARRNADDHPELVALLTDASVDGAVELRLGLPDDERARIVAATVASSVLDMVPVEQRAALLSGLDDVYRIDLPDGGEAPLSEAGLFAAALALDGSFDVEHDGMAGIVYDLDSRKRLAAETMAALADDAGSGGSLTTPQSAFVDVTFATAGPVAYRGYSWDSSVTGSDLDTEFTAAMARVIAINAHPDDAGAQAFHTDRLHAILGDLEANHLLANTQGFGTPTIDAGTRSQLVTTTVFGRSASEELGAETLHWTLGDFHDGTVEADLVVDAAREVAFSTTGTVLTPGDEGRIRRIMATGQGRDLLGLDPDVDPTHRARILHLAIDHDWDEDVFTETGDAWTNPTITLASLSRTAEVNLNGGEPLAPDQIDRLRALVTDDNASDIVGLRTPLDPDSLALVLERVVHGGWTVDTFNAEYGDGDIILNPSLNVLFARPAIDLYAPDGALGQRLADLQGDTEAFVLTALQIEAGSPIAPAARPIVDTIDGYADAQPITLQAVPVTLHFGGQERGTIVLFRVEDADGDLIALVDQEGYHYDSTAEWWDGNTLPHAAVTAPTTAGGATVGDLDLGYGTDTTPMVFRTQDYVDTWQERWLEPGLTVVGVVGGVILIVGSGGTLSPLVMAGGLAMVATASGYEIVGSIDDLRDHARRGGDIGLTDPYARGAWINIGTNAFGIGTAASSVLVSRGARGFAVVGPNGVPTATRTVQHFERVANVVDHLGTGYDVWGILSDPNLTDGEKLWALGQMGLWAAPGYLATQYVAHRGPGASDDVPDLGNDLDGHIRPIDPTDPSAADIDLVALRDQSFAEFRADYQDTYPYGTLSDTELRRRYDLGQRINPLGRSPKYIDTATTPVARPAMVDGSEQVIELAAVDSAAFDEAARIRAQPSLSTAQKVEASQLLGEVGGDLAIAHYVSQHFGPDATVRPLGDDYGGSGQFDQVVLVEAGGRTYVLLNEAKGGTGRLSTRLIDGQEYAQGTPAHTQATIDQLARTDPAAAELIQDAFDTGELIYLTSRVTLDDAGRPTGITIDRFDVTPPPVPAALAPATPPSLADLPALTSEQRVQLETASTFVTNGMDVEAVNDYLATPEGEALLDLAADADPTSSPTVILRRVQDWLRTGTAAPATMTVTEPLVKLVPEGQGVSGYTPFFTTLSALEQAQAQGVSLADHLGLPATSHAATYDLYVIHPIPGAGAVGFASTVATTSELGGLITTAGGATQVIVPDRSRFTDPALITTITESAPLPTVQLPAGPSVWDQPPMTRGAIVERALAEGEYGKPGWEPVTAAGSLVDFQHGQTLVDLTTVDPASPTAIDRMERRIEELSTAGLTVSGAPAEVVLDIRVPPGETAALASLIDAGHRAGITVLITEYP